MPADNARWTRHTISEGEAGATLQAILVGSLGISRRMIQKLTRSSGIRLNGRTAYLQKKVRVGDVVAARLQPSEEPTLRGVRMPLRIILEDADVLVLDKPAGMLVHPVSSDGEATLAHGIAYHWEQIGFRAKVRPVHRLDRDTTGLVLFAKSAHSHQALDRQLRERQLRRTYLAITQGVPSPAEQVVEAPIGPHPRDAYLRSVIADGGARAVTRFRVIEVLRGAALVAVELETGRTHQIRVHFAHIGHALLGDVQYGVRHPGIARQALHAAELSFMHPDTGRHVEVVAELPEDMSRLLDGLRS